METGVLPVKGRSHSNNNSELILTPRIGVFILGGLRPHDETHL